MERMAGIRGKPSVGSSGAGHSRLTTTGNVSQHGTGDAVDMPAGGGELIRMGQAALIAAGMPRAEARRHTSWGPGNGRVGGYQIIFNVSGAQNGGDHTDHLHVGNKRR